ncbi:unnamed protein product [Rhizoctonia solani]|uniref:Uncharacterized protein n=1 Tax=Rhizoctonia solani TaxID=456999 RepID=A0A8H3GV06_9AGAM|nr:unnamed protein product [Rhizoctonia solani]
MDDELWGNAWGSTTDTKTADIKASASPKLTPTWPTKPIATPGLSEGWGTSSAWGASSTSVNLNDAGGGWGDSLEYDNQAPEPVASHTESVVPETKEESESEYEQVVHLSSVDHQADIPHSPLPTSPPPESHTTTTDSRSSSPSNRFSIDGPSQELPVTPRVAQAIIPSSPPQPDLDNSFGGFETGNDARLRVTTGEEDDPWSPAAGDLTFPAAVHDSPRVKTEAVADGDAWGSSWQLKDEKQGNQPPDEWEQARIKKERRDRKVPPEVLSGYLTSWESVVSEIYPDAPLPRSEPTTEWRSPMEEISELQTLRKLYRLPILATALSSPPPILSPLPPYSSLQIHSRQRAALKATRVSAVSQLSPFAHLTSARSIQAAHRFSSKSSVSISKSSLDFGDGVVGVGWAWAHDEKKLEPKPAPSPVTIAPTPLVTNSTPSPTPATPTSRFSGFWTRARGSTDKSSVGQGSRSNTPVPLTSPSTSSLGDATNSTKPPEAHAAEPSPVTAQPQPVEPSAPVPASSGVSRFFKRFSRSSTVESERSRLATSESVSLSAEDLEFLADSVPDTTEKNLLDGGRGLTEFDALEMMLKSKPLPKDIPALAPPPRVTAPSSGSPSPLATVPEGHTAGEDDLWDIFGGPSNGRSNTPSLSTPQRIAPAVASLTPKFTTPVSSAPGSRSHTPRLPSIADISTIVGGKGSHLRQTSFSGRPQQAFRSDVPSLDSPPIPALPPPPGSTATTSLMEMDPFDEFVSAPAELFDQAQARTSFDDFGDFESSAPVPIQVSTISSPPPLSISSPPVTISSIASPPPITFSSPPPPKPPSKAGTPVFVRMGASIQRVDTPPLGALPPLAPPPGHSATSTSVIAPPSNPTQQPQINLFDFGSSPPKNVPVPAPSFAQTSKPTVTPSKGGLSASDLSFFEGL